jgi:protein-tyrosine phosphatase
MIVKSLPIINSYWVIPDHFRAGEHPTIGSVDGTKLKLRWLMGIGVNHIIDLTETGEADVDYPLHIANEAAFLQKHVTYNQYPLPDWQVPSQGKMIEILDTIEAALSQGKNIYLHCYGGKGRTGTVVGCYLVRHGTPVIKVLGEIQELRKEIPDNDRRSPETEAQRKMVIEWNKGR